MGEKPEIFLEDIDRVLANATQLAQLGHCIFDQVRKEYLSVSEEYAKIFGYSVEEFLATFRGQTEDFQLVFPEDLPRVRLAYESPERLAGIDIEYRILRRDGAVRTVREISQHVLDESGAPLRSLNTLQYITQYKRVESELRQSEIMWKQAERTANLGHCVCTETHFIAG